MATIFKNFCIKPIIWTGCFFAGRIFYRLIDFFSREQLVLIDWSCLDGAFSSEENKSRHHSSSSSVVLGIAPFWSRILDWSALLTSPAMFLIICQSVSCSCFWSASSRVVRCESKCTCWSWSKAAETSPCKMPLVLMDFLTCAFVTLGSLVACVEQIRGLTQLACLFYGFFPSTFSLAYLSAVSKASACFCTWLIVSFDMVAPSISESKSEFEVECSLDKWPGELFPDILALTSDACLLARRERRKLAYLSMIRANVNLIVCTTIRYWFPPFASDHDMVELLLISFRANIGVKPCLPIYKKGVCYLKIGGLTKVYNLLAIIVGALLIAGGTYGSWVSFFAFFVFTGIEVAR